MKSFLWRHKSLFVIWLIVFGVIGYIGFWVYDISKSDEQPKTSTKQTSNQPAESTETKSAEPETIEVGETAEDGGIEFTIIGIKCGDTTIGDNQYASAEAESQFCRLSLSAKNTTKSPKSLPLARQRIMVSDQAHPLDQEATQYAQADQSKDYWYKNIPARTTVSGDFVIDTNPTPKPAEAHLYGSETSTGLIVLLPD